MSFSHTVGGFTLPLDAIAGTTRDLSLYYIGNAIQTYCNDVLATAFKQVNHNDGYVIKNVHYYPMEFTIQYLRPQLPMLCIHRKNTKSSRFTVNRDMLTSSVIIEYVLPFTPDVHVEKRYAAMNAVVAAIESLIQRGFQHDGYDLLSDYDIEHISIAQATFGKKGVRYIDTNGFYATEVECNLIEIVDPATENWDDLDSISYAINLGGDDGYGDGYAFSNFATHEVDLT